MRQVALFAITFIALTASGVAGCRREEEPEFDGKTLSEWVSQAKGQGQPLRLAAYDGLGSFPQDATAARTLEEVLNNESASTVERIAAGKNLFRVTGDADKVIGPLRAVIRKEADAASGLQSTKEVEALVFWLGTRAQPLVPDLRYARDKIRGRDAASNGRREAIDKVINAIPNA